MDSTLELGLIGDFLVGSFHPTPLKGVVGGEGLKSEHFADKESRAAFDLIMSTSGEDASVLRSLLVKRCGIAFCEKAVACASTIPAYAYDRIARLAAAGRKRLAAEELTRLMQMQGDFSEDVFFAEIDRIAKRLAHASRKLQAETVGDFLAEEPGALDPIVADAFEAGDKVELIAPSKCRKSFFALDLALHVAVGLPFCGLGIPKPRKVLLVNLEIKRDWMKRRILQRLKGYELAAATLKDNLRLMNCRGLGDSVRETILTHVRMVRPDLVILDPRYKLMRPDEDENTGNGLIGILNLLDAIAEAKAAVMIVSHDKKGDYKSQDIRDRGAGSNWAARDVDCRFVMTPVKDSETDITLGILARNYPPRPAISLRATYGKFIQLV